MSETKTEDEDSSAARTRGERLARRIQEAWESRARHAEEHRESALFSKDVTSVTKLDIYDSVVRVRDEEAGVLPAWLLFAKKRHEELGRYIYALSHEPVRRELPEAVIAEAERQVRALLESTPGAPKTTTLQEVFFVGTFEMVHAKDPTVRGYLDAGMAPEELVCFQYSTFDLGLGMRLALHVEDVARVLSRWGDDTPRKPTKWELLVPLWESVAGRKVARSTWRKYRNDRKATT